MRQVMDFYEKILVSRVIEIKGRGGAIQWSNFLSLGEAAAGDDNFHLTRSILSAFISSSLYKLKTKDEAES